MLAVLQETWHTLSSIPHIGRWLSVAWLLYLVPLCIIIVLQKREPVATLSWLLALSLLPYAGYLIYYVFGPQRIHRRRLKRARARLRLEAQEIPPAAAAGSEISRLAQATTGLPPSSASEATLLVDGGATYDAIVEAVSRARDHVHLEYYIFEPDRSGTRLRDALIERARTGIKVCLLVDAMGSSKLHARFLKPLLEAGAEVAWFHPSRLRLFVRPWINLRSHRKIVVVDGTVAFTGGINITDDENERLNPNAYRDLHLRLRGEIVRSVQQVFVEDWVYASGQGPQHLATTVLWPHHAPLPGDIAVQALASGPDSSWEAIHRLQVSAIHQAQRRVWLVTPYFVPGEAARMALTSAALGGLEVRLLVPRRSDSRLVTWAARSYFEELLAAGVKIYEYGPRMLHSKVLLCDDELAVVGSANFDSRSFRLNFEFSMLFRNRDFCARLERILQDEFDAAKPAERSGSFFYSRLPEAMARLASPLL